MTQEFMVHHLKKKGHITTINKGIFTSCALNDTCPPWSISSNKILHDSQKRQIIYENALLKIYDIPVLYFPKFFHPDPSVKRQSGLLQPQLNNSTILGSSVRLPYFHVLADDKDLTLTPGIFDKDIYMLQNEYRQENRKSSFIKDLGFVNGYKSSNTDNKKKNIGHLFAKFNLDLELDSFEKSDLTLSLEQVTNDTYLKIFDSNLSNIDPDIMPKNKNQMISSLDLNLDHEEYSFDTNFTVYETLNGEDSDRYQYVLPYYSFSKNLKSNNLLSLNFNSNGNNSYQDTNNIKTVINNNFDFKSIDFITDKGFRNNIGIYFKNVNTVAKKDNRYKSSPQVGLMNIVNLETSLPLINEDENYLNSIIPKISYRFNPTDMKNHSTSDRQIKTNNIFSINRLSVSDTYEAGQSLTLGMNYKKESIKDINRFFEFSLATVLRDVQQDAIPVTSTLGEKQSNLFGTTSYNISKLFNLNYDFALDNDLQTFEHNSIGTSFDFGVLLTSFNFVETGGKMGDTNFIENSTKLKFNEDNSLSFNTRRNRKISLTEYYDLVYEYKNDCLIAGVKYKKTYYQDRDLLPTEDLLFSITLFPLSTYETKIDENFMKIKLIKLFVIILIMNFCVLKKTSSIENKILLKIDNEIITSIDVFYETRYLMAINSKINEMKKDDIYRISTNSLIKEKIRNIEIKKNILNDKISIDEIYLNQLLKTTYEKRGFKNLEEFKKHLNLYEIEIAEIKDRISTESLWNEIIYKKFSKKVKIDKKKLREQIIKDNNKEIKSFSISEIVFKISEDQSLNQKLNLIHKDINEKGFSNAALLHSMSDSTINGGELGWFTEKSLNPKIKEKNNKIKNWKIYRSNNNSWRFLILKLNNIKKDKIKYDIEQKLNELIRITTNQQLNQLSNIYFDKVKREIKIEKL